MSSKSSILYDEAKDIHIYREMLDDFFYLDCNGARMKITGKCAEEIEKLYIQRFEK